MPTVSRTEQTTHQSSPLPTRPPSENLVSQFTNLLAKPLDLLISNAHAGAFKYSDNKVTSGNFNSIKQSYDKDGGKVAENAGGKVWGNFKQYYGVPENKRNENWKNTCAIRLSHAMNQAGLGVPSPSQLPSNIGALSSDSSDNFIYKARDFGRYMEKTNGKPIDVDNDLANIQGKKGVIYFDNYHVDLWDGSTLVGNGDAAQRYISEGRSAVFWEAK